MQKIAVLYEASQAVLSTFDLDEVLNQMLNIVRDYFHLRSGSILLVEKESAMLRVRVQFNINPVANLLTIPIGKGITGTAAKIKRPVYVPDVSRDPRYIPGDPDTKSELAIPLIVKDEVVGILDCQSDLPNAFDEEMVDLLTLFATNASIALQNTELYAREQRRASQLEAINKIAKHTTGVTDMDELLGQLCSLLPASFPVDHVSVFLYGQERHLSLRREQGTLQCRVRQGEFLPDRAGYSETALTIGETVVSNDLTGQWGMCEDARSEACLPLTSFGQPIGLLVCSSATPNVFQPSDVQSLESMADIVANAIQNASYVERIQMQADVDGLTGIFNRRYFETKLIEKMEEAKRYGGGLALLMIDIDRFKSVNDDFGHLLGDEVLRQVAATLSHTLRKVDLLCRYGGEEFAIIAPATAGHNAVTFAEKLRKTIEQHGFPGVPRPVTISIGIASYPEIGINRDALVRAADSALYRAKENGRNRVEITEGVNSAAQSQK